MFKTLFQTKKVEDLSKLDSACSVDANGVADNRDVHEEMLNELPVGLGVNFAREFCSELSQETLDALFPAGLEK